MTVVSHRLPRFFIFARPTQQFPFIGLFIVQHRRGDQKVNCPVGTREAALGCRTSARPFPPLLSLVWRPSAKRAEVPLGCNPFPMSLRGRLRPWQFVFPIPVIPAPSLRGLSFANLRQMTGGVYPRRIGHSLRLLLRKIHLPHRGRRERPFPPQGRALLVRPVSLRGALARRGNPFFLSRCKGAL